LLQWLAAHDDIGWNAARLNSVLVGSITMLLRHSLHRLSQVLFLELAHLALNLPVGLLIDRCIHSQLHLLLDVGFDLLHLLSLTLSVL